MTPTQYANYMMSDRLMVVEAEFTQRIRATDERPYGSLRYRGSITDYDGNSVWVDKDWYTDRGEAVRYAFYEWDKMADQYYFKCNDE